MHYFGVNIMLTFYFILTPLIYLFLVPSTGALPKGTNNQAAASADAGAGTSQSANEEA